LKVGRRNSVRSEGKSQEKQVSLPLAHKANPKGSKEAQSKKLFQLRSELSRHKERDREWKLLFNMLAHDLKEPLVTLEGFTQLLESSSPLSKDQRKYLKVLREAVGTLHLLVGSLQSITKLHQDSHDWVDISLQQILESVCTSLAEQIKRNRGKIILPETDLMIRSDPARLYQILINLISNSLKYHKAEVDPEIIIRHRKAGDYHRISIQDNGVGIEPKDLERIFTPFTRLEEVLADGLGLGLSIVKKIAESCGGHVSVKSQRDRGSIFSIYLPRNPGT